MLGRMVQGGNAAGLLDESNSGLLISRTDGQESAIYHGVLLQTEFPDVWARIVYRYDDKDRISEIMHGCGRYDIRYSSGAPACKLAMSMVAEPKSNVYNLIVQ
uniref:Uncharacterized protein n=1 Tax=Anopheles atroparvus TaxID=41427 RepID=A0A182JHB0_ANOAO